MRMNEQERRAMEMVMDASTEVWDSFKNAKKPGLAAYLLKKARDEAVTAQKELIECRDLQRIPDLQNQVRRFHDMAAWMNQAVVMFDTAIAAMQMDEKEFQELNDLVDPDREAPFDEDQTGED